jgi:antitoxin HicB
MRTRTKTKLNETIRYPANVFWSDEDKGFIATAPDLPGSSAFGKSQAEALAQLEHAIEAWIEAAKAAGNPIPEPSRPALEAQPSGKLLLRMPKSLHAELARSAKYENVSLNYYVVFLLTQALTYRTSARDFVRSFGRIQMIEADYFIGQNVTIPQQVRVTQHVSLPQPAMPVIITGEKVVEGVVG